MATIPLPALDVRPPAQQASPLEMYGQMMGIKNAQQEQQLRAQQMQGVQQENQLRQFQVQDQQNLRAAAKGVDWSAPDAYDKFIAGAQQSGVSPTTLAQMSMQRQQYLKSVAETGTAQNQRLLSQNNILLGHIESIGNVADPQQRAATAAQIGKQILADGSASNNPQAQQAAQAMAAGQLVPTDDQLDVFKSTLLDHNTVIGDALKKAQTQSATARATEATASAAASTAAHGPLSPAQVQQLNQGFAQRWSVLNPGAPVPSAFQLGAGATADDFNRADKLMQGTESARQTQATMANTQAYRNAQLSLLGQRVDIQRQQAGISPASGAGAGAAGSANTLAQSIVSGHVAADRMAYLIARNPGVLEQVTAIDPSFDSSKAESYPATYKDFTSGKTSVAINAGGTALSHLYELSQMNTVESHIPGTPDYTAYQNKADTVASELAKFYGDATIPAIAAIKKTLASQLPGNRQAAIMTQARSMGDKLDSYQQQWSNAAPSKAYEAPMPGISPQATRARAALDPAFAARQQQGQNGQRAQQPTPPGGQGGAISVKAPNGRTYTFADQASANAFRQRAGIQ